MDAAAKMTSKGQVTVPKVARELPRRGTCEAVTLGARSADHEYPITELKPCQHAVGVFHSGLAHTRRDTDLEAHDAVPSLPLPDARSATPSRRGAVRAHR